MRICFAFEVENIESCNQGPNVELTGLFTFCFRRHHRAYVHHLLSKSFYKPPQDTPCDDVISLKEVNMFGYLIT